MWFAGLSPRSSLPEVSRAERLRPLQRSSARAFAGIQVVPRNVYFRPELWLGAFLR